MNSEIIYLFMYDSGVRFTEDQLSGLLKNPEDFSKYDFWIWIQMEKRICTFSFIGFLQ